MIMSTKFVQDGYPAAREAGAVPGFPAMSIVWKWVAAWLAGRALKAAEIELQALDDRMLKDLGLTRGEIGSALREHRRDRQQRCGSWTSLT